VSFRELAIEHLGAVYEGLLEYEPRVAEEEMIELRVLGKEFILPPEEWFGFALRKNFLSADLRESSQERWPGGYIPPWSRTRRAKKRKRRTRRRSTPKRREKKSRGSKRELGRV